VTHLRVRSVGLVWESFREVRLRSGSTLCTPFHRTILMTLYATGVRDAEPLKSR
jgi:hypothetical protein